MAMGSLRDNSEKHRVGLHACYVTLVKHLKLLLWSYKKDTKPIVR